MTRAELIADLVADLEKSAQDHDRWAKQFDGCPWIGTEHPGEYDRRQASRLRQAIIIIKAQEADNDPR